MTGYTTSCGDRITSLTVTSSLQFELLGSSTVLLPAEIVAFSSSMYCFLRWLPSCYVQSSSTSFISQKSNSVANASELSLCKIVSYSFETFSFNMSKNWCLTQYFQMTLIINAFFYFENQDLGVYATRGPKSGRKDKCYT